MRQGHAVDGRPTGLRAAWATATQAWFTPAAVILGLFNVLMSAAIVLNVDGDAKMPGRLIGPAIMTALAISLFAGLRMRWHVLYASRTPGAHGGPMLVRSTVGRRLGLGAIAAVAVAGAAVGVMVGSLYLLIPGVLALVGVAKLASSRAPGSRATPAKTANRPNSIFVADVLIVVGTLPALGLWWMVIPPILALVVIGGVIGTGPGTRRHATA